MPTIRQFTSTHVAHRLWSIWSTDRDHGERTVNGTGSDGSVDGTLDAGLYEDTGGVVEDLVTRGVDMGHFSLSSVQ